MFMRVTRWAGHKGCPAPMKRPSCPQIPPRPTSGPVQAILPESDADEDDPSSSSARRTLTASRI
jgi:hypothetical protein